VSLWDEAFEQTGIDPAWYAHRERSLDEVLPWAHLHSGPSIDYLRRQYEDLRDRTAARPVAGQAGNGAV